MTDDCLVIVMEYASGGPLQDRIKTSGRLAEAEAKRFFGQLVDGIMYCHSQVSLPAAMWHPMPFLLCPVGAPGAVDALILACVGDCTCPQPVQPTLAEHAGSLRLYSSGGEPAPAMQHIFHRDLRMENLLLQGSYYDSILKISNFGYSKSAVLDSVAVTLGLGGGGQGQVL